MTGVKNRARERIAKWACKQGIEPEELVCRLVEMGLDAMDEADAYYDVPPVDNVVSLHGRAR